MSELPLNQAIPRMKTNESFLNDFLNGVSTATVTLPNGVVIPTLAKIAQDATDAATAISSNTTFLQKTSDLSDVANPDTALSNLGGSTAGVAVFKGSAAAGRTALGLSAAAISSLLPITTGGTGTAYTISTGATAYVDGQNYRFALHATNGAAPTVQDGALAAVPFKVDNAGTLAAPAAGQMVINTVIEAVYSASATAMIITNGLFATAAVAATGTATGIAVDPAGVAAAIAGIPTPVIPAPTTAQVESAMAGANAQDVGTFGVFAYASSGNPISAGTNYAGSSLNEAVIGVPTSPGSMNGSSTTAHPAGTWKAMTSCGAQSGYFPTATFLRIA